MCSLCACCRCARMHACMHACMRACMHGGAQHACTTSHADPARSKRFGAPHSHMRLTIAPPLAVPPSRSAPRAALRSRLGRSAVSSLTRTPSLIRWAFAMPLQGHVGSLQQCRHPRAGGGAGPAPLPCSRPLAGLIIGLRHPRRPRTALYTQQRARSAMRRPQSVKTPFAPASRPGCLNADRTPACSTSRPHLVNAGGGQGPQARQRAQVQRARCRGRPRGAPRRRPAPAPGRSVPLFDHIAPAVWPCPRRSQQAQVHITSSRGPREGSLLRSAARPGLDPAPCFAPLLSSLPAPSATLPC
jgi:hypothetical protein